MCGFAGLISWDPVGSVGEPRDGAPAWWPAASARLAHRGPDGEGLWSGAARPAGFAVSATIGHRRLAIIDRPGGGQPLVTSSAGGELVVAFNGCIYNHAELRRQLVSAGRRFATDHSDTEVIPQGVATWGTRLWDELDGMYAVALFDTAAGSLTLARDPVGEKPLYYCEWTEGRSRRVAFASTIPALLTILTASRPGWKPTIDAREMHRWFAFGRGDQPPWLDIRSLTPGERRVWLPGANAESTRSRWSPDRRHEGLDSDPVATTERLLLQSVGDRLDADVPIGVFLSGGIDSPLIAWAASKRRPGIDAFTVRMPDADFDESDRAKAVAAHLGLTHHILECDPRPVSDLTMLIEQLGLPFGDSSLLPTHWVAKAARRHVTVALGGDGADELFDGYQRYRGAALLRRFREVLALLPGETGPARSRRAKLGRLADAARGAGYLDMPAIFPVRWARELLPQALYTRHDPAADADPSLHDLGHYLPDDLLRKTDAAAMAVALEARSPYLARAIVADRLGREPEDRGGKRVLRALAAKHLPAWIAKAPKSGFAVPVGRWIRDDFGGYGSLVGDAIRTKGAWDATGLAIDAHAAGRLLDAHLAGREDHSQRLHHLAVLAVFSRWASRLG